MNRQKNRLNNESNILKFRREGETRKNWVEPVPSQEVLRALINAIDAKDHYTHKHCSNVGVYAKITAQSMGLDNYQQIGNSADIHDVGKIGVRDSVLLKPGRLTADEYSEIQNHVFMGYRIISSIESFEDIANIVLYHHERWDGQGYPHNLKGENIPIESRIIAVCDTFDAITTTRCYNMARSHDEAMQIINDNSGSQLDPEIVKYFENSVYKQIKATSLACNCIDGILDIDSIAVQQVYKDVDQTPLILN